MTRAAGTVAGAAGLALVLGIAFFPVIRGRATLLPVQPGVMPDGPYGYTGPRPAPAVLDPAASAIKYLPVTALVSRMWKRGELPFWNPFCGGGVPLWANGEAFACAPLRLPLYLDPSARMWNAWWLLRLWLAGCLTAALARHLGISMAGSLGAGTAYMLGGYLVLSLNLMHLDVDILLPGLLLAVDRLLGQPRSQWGFVAVAGVTWAMALGGGPQALAVDALLAAVWVLVRSPGRVATAQTVLAGATGMAGSLPFWFPFLEVLGRAHHLHGAGAARSGASVVPMAGLRALVGPWLDRPDAQGLPSYYYAGEMVLLLAVAGAWSASRRGRAGTAVPARLLVGVACFELWKIFGGPGSAALGALPGLSLIWWGKYAGPLALSLALLAGFGLDRLARGRWLPGWGLALALAAELVALRPGPLPAPHDPLRPAPYVGWLQSRVHAEPGWRICGLGTVLMPDIAAAFDLPDIRLEDSLIDREQYRVLFDGISAPKEPRLSMFITLDALDPRRLDALRGLGVRWLLAWKEWRPVPAVAPALVRVYDAEIGIWQIRGARPFPGWPPRGRRLFWVGCWAAVVLVPVLLWAGLSVGKGPSRRPSRMI